MDFLLVLIGLFSLRVTAEALQAKIDPKWAISLQRGQFEPTFLVEMVASYQLFLYTTLANECLTTLSLTVFTQRNFVADFLQSKGDFRPKLAVLRF